MLVAGKMGPGTAIEFPIRATKTIAIDAASIAFFRSIPPFKSNNLILLDDSGFIWATHLF